MIGPARRLRGIAKQVVRLVISPLPLWLPWVLLRRLRWIIIPLYRGVRMNARSAPSAFNFRRNIHRIEKGLSFPVRRRLFAEDYILETVRLLDQGLHSDSFDRQTAEWGGAVLERYFGEVGSSPIVDEARIEFARIPARQTDPRKTPYRAGDRPVAELTADELQTLAMRRRSIRFFLDRPVDRELIEKALDIALQAPSSCNRQAYRFLYFDDPAVVRRLSEVPGGIAGYRVQSLVVVVGTYRAYFDERDVKAPIVDASLAAMLFILALETMGLGSVCINWPSHASNETRLRSLISLDRDETVVMFIGIGYPDPEGLVAYSAKRPSSEVLSVNPSVRSAPVPAGNRQAARETK